MHLVTYKKKEQKQFAKMFLIIKGLLDEHIRTEDREKAKFFFFFCMQCNLFDFIQTEMNASTSFCCFQLKHRPSALMIIGSESRTNLSELRCQWLRRYVPRCVYKNTSNSLTSTQWRGTGKQQHSLPSKSSDWCDVCRVNFKRSEREITVLMRIAIFELSDPCRWPLHSSASDLVCGTFNPQNEASQNKSLH